MARARWIVVVMLVAGPGAGRAQPSPSPSAAERAALRDDARLVLEAHCGQCHISAYPTALPRALAVFDLLELEWAAHMTAAQLHSARWRLDEPLPPDGKERVPPQERARVARYLEWELAARRRAATGGAPARR